MKIRIEYLKYVIVFFIFSVVCESIAKTKNITIEVEEWNVLELILHSDYDYDNPFIDVKIDAIFEGPRGVKMIRPAFWDGGRIWKIRFSPPQKGMWTMTTISNKYNDRGLHAIKRKIKCKKYKGKLEIYKHGFVKVSDNGRYFIYNDGTPFFYLADTHWCFLHERYGTSNVAGIDSQFRYVVDKRTSQGFTVYQSEAIQYFDHYSHSNLDYQLREDEEPHCSFDNGLGEDDIPGLRNLDRKFAYIANKGLLHVNSQICWTTEPALNKQVFTEEYMYNLGKYWSARFGAYPVLWTVAQEVDKNLYGRLTANDLELWKSMAIGLTENDCYSHPLSAHMEEVSNTNANNSSWGNLKYHTWWAIQWRDAMNDPQPIKTFWYNNNIKPCILYESGYENIAVDEMVALRQGFIAFQSGLFGYGYGANGIWNDLYDRNDVGTSYYMPQHYLHWYEGANLKGAALLSNLKKFYMSFSWWKLEPRYNDEKWGIFEGSGNYAFSSINNSLYLVYFWENLSPYIGILKKLKNNVSYVAKWYRPCDGSYLFIGEYKSTDGEFKIPDKPSQDDWMFILEEKGSTSEMVF